jgi:hypothetical protein
LRLGETVASRVVPRWRRRGSLPTNAFKPRHPPPDLESGARVQSFWEDDIDA